MSLQSSVGAKVTTIYTAESLESAVYYAPKRINFLKIMFTHYTFHFGT